MNTSLLFEELTKEEFSSILNSISVPVLCEPIKNNLTKYFGKEVIIDSVSRFVIEDIYFKNVYKTDKDFTLAIYLTNQVINFISKAGLSEKYTLLLQKKHEKDQEDFKNLIKEISTIKCVVKINMFFKMLKEEEVEVYDDTSIVTGTDEEVIEEFEEEEILGVENTDEIDFVDITVSDENDYLTIDDFLDKDETKYLEKTETESDDLFGTMDDIHQTVEDLKKEINGISLNNLNQDNENDDNEKIAYNTYQELIREKRQLSMELNKNRIKILTLESQLDQALYSMRTYVKKVEEVADEMIENPNNNQKIHNQSLAIVSSYKDKKGISGNISVYELWSKLSKIEDCIVLKMVKERKVSTKEELEVLNGDLKEVIKVKESLQILIAISK